MANYYVNANDGNDAWNGTSETPGAPDGPKQHIQAMVDALPDPIEDETIINLAGTIATPQQYMESEGQIDLAGLRLKGAGQLIFQPVIWN